MDQSPLPVARALIAALAAWAPSLPGQGPVYRERWGFLHLEHRRAELRQELLAADAVAVASVAARLAGPDGGVPFAPVASALADRRGVPADDAFLLRAMLSVYVLPEVADPEGANEVCRRTNVSVFLPFAMPVPEDVAFDLLVLDAGGEPIWSVRFGEGATLEDLRMARLVVPVPADELEDGAYRLRLSAWFGHAGPGPGQPVLEWPFHVRRGYQARCEAAFAAVQERGAALPDEPRAFLTGLAAEVRRAYAGEAFDVASDAVADLERLELALRNVAADRHVLAGMTGDVPVLLPSQAARGLAAVLRLPDGLAPGAGRDRPLVVFAAATPAYDLSVRRPTAPASRGPRWTAHELAGFGGEPGWDVAFLESPGEVRNYIGELQAALGVLRSLYGTGPGRVLLVADGEAASLAGFHAPRLVPELAGLVLVGSGGLSATVLDALGALRVRLQPVVGHRGSDGLERSLAYVAAQVAADKWHGDVARLSPREVPWPMAVPLLRPELEAFAAQLFAR
ncbi:MAG: hypothetical protein KF830_01120 [Planctomycetes bacterium]|nr:hypothetical protein [Planctomycetota bacterium]